MCLWHLWENHSVRYNSAHVQISVSGDVEIVLPSSAASHELPRIRQPLQGQSYEDFMKPGTSLMLIPWTSCGSDLLTRGQSLKVSDTVSGTEAEADCLIILPGGMRPQMKKLREKTSFVLIVQPIA